MTDLAPNPIRKAAAWRVNSYNGIMKTCLEVTIGLGFAVALGCTSDEGVGEATSPATDGPIVFEKARDISGGAVSGLSALIAADLNGDGLIDVGVFEGGKHADGRVTFAWYQSPAIPSSGTWSRHEFTRPASMRNFIGAAQFGDVDGDGDPDLVVSMDNHSGAARSAYIYWLENPRPAIAATGAWVVHSIVSDLQVNHINDMELADMDGDARLDVVVRSLEPSLLIMYFQDPAGSWTERTLDTSPYGATGEGFAIGDLDQSGELDISIAGHWLRAPADPRVDAYGSYTIDAEYKTINANTKEAIGDIDRDGRMDVIISPAEGYRNGGNHVLAWYRNPIDPTSVIAWERTILESDLNGGQTVKLADMDLDGDLDVLSAVSWSMWGQSKAIRIYFNDGNGRFGTPQTVVLGKGLYTGVTVDVGNDRDLDIIGQDTYSGSSRPYLYESRASEDTPPDPDAGAEAPGTALD